MLIFFAVLGGFILDAIFGDPLWLPHPVVYMGKVISFLDQSLRKILPKTPRGELAGGLSMRGRLVRNPGMVVESDGSMGVF